MQETTALGTFGKMIRWLVIGWTAITFLVFVPAFNWMHIANYSYNAWMPDGILKATGRGIVWPVYIFDLSKKGPAYYARQALDAAERAKAVVAGLTPGQIPSSEQLDEFDLRLMDVIEQAREIDCAFLNQRYPGLGDHFEQELLGGMDRLHQAVMHRDPQALSAGAALMARWAEWYSANRLLIRARI